MRIRCHRCGTSKSDEDVGIYTAWIFGNEIKNRSVVWFHSDECKEKWKEKYHYQKIKELKKNIQIDTGLTKILSNTDDLEL